MKKPILFCSLCLASFLSYGQKPLSNSRLSSLYTYVYRLADHDMELFYSGNKEHWSDHILHHPVDSFKTDNPSGLNLTAGNYVQVEAQRNKLQYTLIQKRSAHLKLLENGRNLLFILTDLNGKEISQAEVFLGKRRVGFNEAAQAYDLRKRTKDTLLRVSYEGLNNFYSLTEEPLYKPKKPGFFKRIWGFLNKPFRKKPKTRSYYYTPPLNPGYMVFSKPKYRPGDTVKFKAFIVEKKSKKPVKDRQLLIRLKESQWDNGKIIGRVSAYRPGGFDYEFTLSDSLGLLLDESYMISLETLGSEKYNLDEYDGDLEDMVFLSKRTVYQQGSFEYEEYELKTNRFSVRTDKTKHSPGNPVSVYFKATDENDLSVRDGRVELSLTTQNARNFKTPVSFVPDTLWRHKLNLDAVGETKLIIPNSIFPKADIDYRLKAIFLNSNNESLEQTKYLSFSPATQQIDASLAMDTLKISYELAGKASSRDADLIALNAAQDTLSKKRVRLPHAELIRPNAASYLVKVEDVTKLINMSSFSADIGLLAHRKKDSISIRVTNPRNIKFWYTVFAGKDILAQGAATRLDYALPFAKKQSVSVLLNYLWADRPEKQEAPAPYREKLLSIDVQQPLAIYPGQKAKLEIFVKDFNGKPLNNADLTAYSFTRKFANYSPPSIPYLGKNYPLRALDDPYRIEKTDERGEMKLNWQRWSREMGLDSIEFYRFTHPEGLYRMEEPAPDSITQIAPFVMEDGEILPVHIVYIDRIPVYFSKADQLHRYSFAVDPGVHTIELRTANKKITLKNILVNAGLKLILAANAHAVPSEIVSVSPMPGQLDAAEARRMNHYMISVVPNFRERIATLRQGKRALLIGLPEEGTGMARWQTQPFLTGPLNPFPWIFQISGHKPVQFDPEPGYSYEFKPGFLKQKSLEAAYPFSFDLPVSEIKGTDHTHYALSAKEADSLWRHFTDLQAHSTSLFKNKLPTGKERGTLTVRVDSLANGTLPFVKSIFVFKKDEPDFMNVYPGRSTDLGHFKPGNYRILFLLKGDDYLLQEDLLIRASGINFYSISKARFYKRDSLSIRFAKILAQRTGLNRNSENTAAAAQALKEIFNEKYLDESLFTGWLSGHVFDAKDKTPLVGVTVKVKGTRRVTTTDVNGFFKLKVPATGAVQINYIGFYSQEKTIMSGQQLTIYLEESSNALEEVVVIGYGTQKKAEFTGSVSSVSGSLQGVVAGVQIRGTGTFDAVSLKPLVVVDGLIYEGGPESLLPSEIGEMSILKGPDAVAIYGSRGANGVIIITTTKSMALHSGSDSSGMQAGGGLRKNFSDAAFWLPRLRTDADGKAAFEVTFPDDITNWRTFFIGMSDKQHSGFAEGQIKSFKPISASFNSPLFAVRGDRFEPIGKIMNYTTDTTELSRSFSYNGQLITEDRLRLSNSRIDTFKLKAEGKDSLQFKYSICRPGGYVDGEERSIPLFEKGVTETKGMFEALEKDTTLHLQFDAALGKVTLRAEASLLPVLMEEAGRLRNYEYLCNEQLASKLKGLLAEKRIRAFLSERFNRDKEVTDIIRKLMEGRRKEGTWGWWKDSEEEYWISLHAMESLLDAETQGYKTKVDKQALTDYLLYRSPSLKGSEQLRAIELLLKLGARTDYPALFNSFENQLVHENRPSQYNALRLMFVKQQAGIKVSLDSLLAKQRATMFGNIYWGEPGFRFFDNSIQLSVLAYRILKNEGRHPELLKKLRNYFLEQRGDGHWRNTYESSLILETILPDILVKGSKPANPRLNIAGKEKLVVKDFPFTTTLQPTEKISVSKVGDLPVYFSAYQQFINSQPQRVEKDFKVNSWFEKNQGKITDLKGGEPVELKVEVDARADADYILIEVPVPAGCSYASKHQSFGFGNQEVHREHFKNKVSIFCKKLKQGPHRFTIHLIPRYSGTYTLNPAKAEMMYFPVFYGREQMKEVNVK